MFRALVMSTESSVRRVRNLSSVLTPPAKYGQIRWKSSSRPGEKEYISIGDVSIELKKPTNPELVPKKYLPDPCPQSILSHLRWIMQKDVLGQDIFLIGPPGPLRRTVAMMYLELTKREVEYMSLSRDTTEMDLKQRREITSGSAYHIDQCAVRAATKGRVLVLEGIEKAERNVLPVLNNLLENREMQLDDGRFLMAAERYDKLLKEHSQAELDKWKLVRVDESFRVIALGLPVPRYRGNPLDPPLRSRFQARDINQLPFKDHLELLNKAGVKLSPDKLSQILSFASTLKTDEAGSLGLPDFPLDNLHDIVTVLNAVPQLPLSQLMERLYPHKVMLGKEGQTAVNDALKTFGLSDPEPETASGGCLLEVRRSGGSAVVQLNPGSGVTTVEVPCGNIDIDTAPGQKFVSTSYHDNLLADMMLSHMVKDFCVVGPRGCGKSVVVKHFADMLGYHIEPIMLYQDMTSRDLLQQRMTLPSGDTAWRPSPLVTAALEGSLAVLDGIHRINPGTFAVLHRLIHDRELALFDGTRLLRPDRYDAIKEEQNLTEEDMAERGIRRIHPSFRIIALAEPPVVGSSTQQWLNSEILTMFLYHNMRPLSRIEEAEVLQKLVPNLSNIDVLLDLTHKLRESGDSNLKSVAASLSTRQLFRIAKRLAQYPDEDLYSTVHRSCLSQFLPRLARNALDEELEASGIKKPQKPMSVESMDKAITCEIRNNILRIGNTEVPVHNPDNKVKVPDILFYENPQHLAVMENMLKDYLLGEHLLLVGNQGVGKNKIIDRFLHLLNRPREYIQLHRDTTVQTLTLQPTVRDGVISYEDSPLVRAVKDGLVLVVDEADKAPTNVTCILKTLVESGEMHLADGRRIVSANSGLKSSENIIVAHPDFRMFVLANRPGFPFLGNDFFGALGDIFSCHAVDNPDTESEMAMLRQYGPDVPEDILRKLVLAFGDLRSMADQGLITYPYSTREVVNMVKHLQKFPGEGLVAVTKNVFDFDSYNKEFSETVIETLHKHGIPVGARPDSVHLAKEYPLPPLNRSDLWEIRRYGDVVITGVKSLPVEERHLRIKGPIEVGVTSYSLDRTEARSLLFTEQEAYWTIPMHETSAIVDVAVTKGSQREPDKLNDDLIHIATANPLCLFTMNPTKQHLTCLDLYDIFPSTVHTALRPRLKIATLSFPLDTQIVLHEELSNIILIINTETGQVTRIETATLLESAADKITKTFRSQLGSFKMCSHCCQDRRPTLLFYKQTGQNIDVLDVLEGRCHSVTLPFKIDSVHMMSRYHWLIEESDSKRKFIVNSSEENPLDYYLHSVEESDAILGELQGVAPCPLHDIQLGAILDQEIQSPHRLIMDSDHYVAVAVGLPDLMSVEVYGSERRDVPSDRTDIDKRIFSYVSGASAKSPDPVVYLPDSGQIVRALSPAKVPEELRTKRVKRGYLAGYLEVTDPINKLLRYIPIPGVLNRNVYSQWFDGGSDVNILMASTSHDGIVTVDAGGCVRLWETALMNLDKSLKSWRSLLGEDSERPLQITRELGKVPDGPKHGVTDPTRTPHIGGNMFAGGVGGMNTAGLGGMGGPYRLDLGNKVIQVPDWEKRAVPPEVQKAAREMAEKAYKERLREIKMSEYDGSLYKQYSDSVQAQVKSLKIILDSLQAKGKERQWLRHKTQGDLDDAKLIEGLAGEKAIYKQRGEQEPEMGSPQEKPKIIRLVCDVSGSMYRFNGYDGRLEREMEAMLMVMEALEKYEHKIKYEIVGHSGEGYKFDFVTADKPPKNNKERLDVIKALHAHSQFCISGDNTLEATREAIKAIKKHDADEHFVIVLSDANLSRYGISPKRLANLLTSDDDVNAYVIFIGSLGDQANRLMKQMPAGRAFLCLDTKNLPHILQQIFTSTMLNTR